MAQFWKSASTEAKEGLFEVILDQGKRLFYLDSELQLVQNDDWQFYLEFSEDGGVWKVNGSQSPASWQLPAESLTTFATVPALDAIEEVLRWKNDSNSDCAFAFEWATHDGDWQMRRVLAVKRGRLEEFEKLIRIATWSDKTLAAEEIYWSIEIEKRWFEGLVTGLSSLNANIWSTAGNVALSSRWQAFLKILQHYFSLHVDLSTIQKHACAENLWHYDGVYWIIVVPIASARERVEAHLQWREWVETHLPPDQWKTILFD